MEIYELLNFIRKIGASDLHLSPNHEPIVRVDGEVQRTDLPQLSAEDVHLLSYDIMNEEQKKRYEEEWELDFSRDFKGIGRFRINVFKGYFGDTVVMRAISEKCFTFEELRLPPILKKLALSPKGLILVTGPTGSGKSTTLNTIIDYINRQQRKHIILIEDPVEYIHESRLALINHREVGIDTHSFSKALRSSLREDPDVIVVGEMRDLETTALAISAAETGHLVFGTLHTVNSTKTIDRIIDQFPSSQQNQIRLMISETLIGVISQILLKKNNGGRVAAFEVMLGIPAVANLIREKKIYQLPSILQTNTRMGMVTLEQSIDKLVRTGIVSKDALLDVNSELSLALAGAE